VTLLKNLLGNGLAALMSTKFEIEVTLVELINNNFLLFQNDLNLSA
jgi:hypothetical protein